MNKLIVTGDLIFNIDYLVYLTPNKIILKTGERIAVTKTPKDPGYADYETSGTRTINIYDETFKNIKTKIEEIQSQLMYEKKYNELKTHIVCSPGGTEYLIAKQDFEKMGNLQIKDE